MTYITHARTPEELRLEIVSDLNRRIDRLKSYGDVVSRNAAEKARIASAVRELEEMLHYWSELQIVLKPSRRAQPKG